MNEPTTEDLLEQTLDQITVALRQLTDGQRDVVKILQGVQQWCQLMEERVSALERGVRPWARQAREAETPERNQG